MAFRKIVTVGAGNMGRGISWVVASTGTEVILIDKTDDLVERGIRILSEEMDKEIEKWGLTQAEKRAILSRIKGSTDISHAAEVGLVIEAIPEDMEVKRELFARLDQICPPETIIVTNTSTLSITEIAATTSRPDRVIGLHFLPPVHKIPLVEIVRGLRTSDEAFDIVKGFAVDLGKTAVSVFEYPGYVTTRIIVPLLNEAMHVLMEGIASADDIVPSLWPI
jgi:3-hydroxybutyryl-CoA dehydrogenase